MLAGEFLIMVIGRVVTEDEPYTVFWTEIHFAVVVVGLHALVFLSEYEVFLDELPDLFHLVGGFECRLVAHLFVLGSAGL